MKTVSRVFFACKKSGLFAFLLFLSSPILANPSLPSLFTDHMVVQQGRAISVWGKADSGEKINVALAGNGVAATADADGLWNVHLPPLSAGGPFTLSIRGKREILIKDVMIGEVWIASGQSNMTFSLEGTQNAATELAKANDPQLRLFTVPRRIAVTDQFDTLPAHWEICTPQSAREFSAVAYFFARELRRRLNVPVGVIESAWPGTPIQQWIAADILRGNPDLRSTTEEWDQATPAQRQFAERPASLDLEFDDFELLKTVEGSESKVLTNFDDGTSRLSTGGAFFYSWSDAPQTTFDLAPGHGSSGFAAKVSGQLTGAQDSTLSANYKQDASPADLSAYSGIRFWVRGNGSFRFRSKQPSISDYDDYATPVLKATPDWRPVVLSFRDLRQDGWGVVRDFTPQLLTGFSLECLTPLEYAPMPVSSLYEGMITPLLGYRLRGVIWYQGESNALEAHQYRKLLPALIQNWRDGFHQKDLEFLIVQLPNHGAIQQEPGESAWAELREAQLMTVRNVPQTGLAVTIDVGDPKDLHPHRKREVGERLAFWALGMVYQQPGEYSGPLYEAMKIEGTEVRLRFSHVGSGLEAHGGGAVQGFAIAGADQKFHWAKARIEGNEVIVSSPAVLMPVAVRYAWGDSPSCNLFNRKDLPASPFRTDNWQGITAPRDSASTVSK